MTCTTVDLPPELWHEIISHFPVFNPDPAYDPDGAVRSALLLNRSATNHLPRVIPTALATRFRERETALRSLSQTCASLRALALPLLWEYVEACFEGRMIADFREVWPIRVLRVMRARCRGLVENVALGQHVRVFSVSLTHYSWGIAPLVQCLASLPNLHTLHVLYVPSAVVKDIPNHFGRIELPSLRTIVLPSVAHAILPACPKLRNFSCNEEIRMGNALFDTLVRCCPLVERSENMGMTSERIERLSLTLPRLNEIVVPADMGNVSSLASLSNLSTIELLARKWELPYASTGADSDGETDADADFDDEDDFSPGTAHRRRLRLTAQRRVAAAQGVLTAAENTGSWPKRVKMSYWDHETQSVGVDTVVYRTQWVRTDVYEVVMKEG